MDDIYSYFVFALFFATPVFLLISIIMFALAAFRHFKPRKTTLTSTRRTLTPKQLCIRAALILLGTAMLLPILYDALMGFGATVI